MKVLYVSQKPHAPIVDGGTQAIADFYGLLNDVTDIDLYYAPLCTPKHPIQNTESIKNYFPIEYSPGIQMSQIFSICKIPINVLRYQSNITANKLNALESLVKFDTIICDGFYALVAVAHSPLIHKNVIYRMHNLETKHWEQRGKFENGLKKLITLWVARLMNKYEIDLVKKVKTVLCISNTEYNEWLKLKLPAHLFLPSVEIKEASHSNIAQIGFIGSFDWYPNREGIEWFINEVWPLIQKTHPHAKLNIAGKGSEKFTSKRHNIHGLGFVPNLKEFYDNQSVMVSPLRSGTGFNIKALEALSYGKPLVATQVSTQGFVSKEGILVGEKPLDFAHHVIHLLADDSVRNERVRKAIDNLNENHQRQAQLKLLQNLIHGKN